MSTSEAGPGHTTTPLPTLADHTLARVGIYLVGTLAAILSAFAALTLVIDTARPESVRVLVALAVLAGSCAVVTAILGVDYRKRLAADRDWARRQQMHEELLDGIKTATASAAMAAVASMKEARRGGYVEAIREAFAPDEGDGPQKAGTPRLVPVPRSPNGNHGA